MINLNDGILIIQGVEIRPFMKISEFEKYDGKQVEIERWDDCSAAIVFQELVISDGIPAEVTIEIDEEINMFNIIILPGLKDNKDLELLEASKKWLHGFAPQVEFEESDTSIGADFEWGYICAQYVTDRDYGQRGGDINIVYEVM